MDDERGGGVMFCRKEGLVLVPEGGNDVDPCRAEILRLALLCGLQLSHPQSLFPPSILKQYITHAICLPSASAPNC